MEIGDLIKQKRKEAGLTQEALAQKVGCATITIRQYESGKRSPNLNILQEIASALNIEIFDLLPDDPTRDDPFAGLSEDDKKCIMSVSGENNVLKAILTIFFQLPDDRKILFLKELKRLEKEAEEESHAVDPQENN